jgi:4-hydroxy-tetrahydrodipicolinate synthase
LFIEANPIPVKWAVQQLGHIGETLRLPLTSLSAEFHERVRGAMQQAGVL